MSSIKDYVDLAASNPALFDTVNKYDIDGIESGFNESDPNSLSFAEALSAATKDDRLNTQYGKQSLSKINNGQVLQYPVDLDTSIQDYFEIQIFKYRPAKVLPGITRTSQGYGIKSNTKR